MRVRFQDGAAVITGMTCFEPRHIFDNGQTFRFDETEEGVFEGVACGRFLRVAKKESVAWYRRSRCDIDLDLRIDIKDAMKVFFFVAKKIPSLE